MDRLRVLKQIEREWKALTESCGGLSDAEMTQPGVQGDWSVRDVLAHVTTWEEEALKYLPLIVQGDKPPRYLNKYGGIDAFNAQMMERKRDLGLGEVLQQLNKVHGRLIEYVQNAPAELFAKETRFRRRLRLDTYSHYPVHVKAIRDWRERTDRG